MRIRSLLTAIALFATTVFAVEIVCMSILMIYFPSRDDPRTLLSASVPDDEESFGRHVEDPVLSITTSFPEDNPFGRMSPYRDFSPVLLKIRHGIQMLLMEK